MATLKESVDKFLEFNDYSILKDKRKVPKKEAESKAHEEYEIFNKTQPIGNDFKKFLNDLKKKGLSQ